MNVFSNGAVTLFNGFLELVGAATSPMTLVGALLGVSLLWLALIEIDELDRQGTKPEIGRGQ